MRVHPQQSGRTFIKQAADTVTSIIRMAVHSSISLLRGAVPRALPFFTAVLMTFPLFSASANDGETAPQPVASDNAVSTLEERLLTDWIYQDFGLDASACFSSAASNENEAQITQKALDEIEATDIEPLRTRRQTLLDAGCPGNDPEWKTLYTEICRKRRAERLSVVAEETPEIIYAKHYVMGASHYTYTEDTTDTTWVDVSPDRKGGSSLRRLTVAADGTVQDRTLVETTTGVIRDPDVSFDGRKIIFSMRENFVTDDFGLYEYDVETGRTRGITRPKGFADYEPAYLPDGNILFVSSRCMRISDCWWTEISNLYLCGPDGSLLRRLGYDQVTTNYPKVLNDGRILYTRWEYQDRGQIFPQPLFTMNSDGTGQTEYYGNGSFFPTTILHARGIPGSSKVIGVAMGHHTRQRGKLILVDRNRGTQETSGIEYVAPKSEAIAEKVDVAQQDGAQFQYPYAIDEQNYLVGYSPEEIKNDRYDPPFGLYWMDDSGRRELLAFDRSIGCCQPVPLAPRELPPNRPSQVDYTQKTGRFYVQDVYVGPSMAGVTRGTVKKLRVIEPMFNRVVGIRHNRNKGPAGSSNIMTPVSIDNGAWDSKRVLGETEVKEDGSAYFEVPAEVPFYFQLLDENDRVVQTMRSWSTLMPGELFACVGCHEPKESTPGASAMSATPGTAGTSASSTTSGISAATVGKSLALAGPPTPLTFSERSGTSVHPDSGFSFIRDVQPILDRRCVSCHDGRPQSDGSPPMLPLLGDAYDPTTGPYPLCDDGRVYSVSYVWLTQGGKQNEWVNWLNMQSVPPILPPFDSGSIRSRLITMFDSPDENHRDVGLTPDELKTLALWIDLAVPFCGFPTEANCWNDGEKSLWAYYSMKQSGMRDLMDAHRRNLLLTVSDRGTEVTPVPEFHLGGAEAKKSFVERWPTREIPNRILTSGEGDRFRNLALNPDSAWEKTSYPFASSNAEAGYAEDALAKNAIDGQTSGGAWRPGLRTDAALTVDFGAPVELEKIVLTLLPGTLWKSAVVTFDDGSEETVPLSVADGSVTFEFPRRTTRRITLGQFDQDFPLRPGGVVEFQAWGVPAP